MMARAPKYLLHEGDLYALHTPFRTEAELDHYIARAGLKPSFITVEIYGHFCVYTERKVDNTRNVGRVIAEVT